MKTGVTEQMLHTNISTSTVKRHLFAATGTPAAVLRKTTTPRQGTTQILPKQRFEAVVAGHLTANYTTS